MAQATDSDAPQYTSAVLARLTEDDPRNGHEEGTEMFRPGMPEETFYEVITDEGIEKVHFEIVETFETSSPMTRDEIVNYAVGKYDE